MNARKAVVYIVEDDPSFRKSVERLVQASGFEVVSFGSANAFLEQSVIRRPACLLLDVQLPDIDGIELQQMLVERGGGPPIVFMTGHGDIPMGINAMKRGAVDFLIKPVEPQELQNAVLRALACDTRNVEIANRVKLVKALFNTLTPREMDVLRYVIAGRLNKQIACALGTTEKTIKVHRGRIMRKTRASSVAELVRLAEQVDIVPIG